MHPAELPTFEATWWPVSMETVAGSGEAITVAIIVRAASGQSSIRQVIDPATLNAMFGSHHHKGMHWMVSNVVVHAQKALDQGVPVEQLTFAFGGFQRLHARDCVARDLNEVFDLAVSMASGFVDSPFGRRADSGDAGGAAFHDWAAGVREVLFASDQVQLQEREFNVRVKLHNKTVSFGLLHGAYAANFGVLRPGHASSDMRSLKVKLFDLGSLRNDPLRGIDRFEVLMGCPPGNALASYSRREVDGFHQTLEFIMAEARTRDVTLVRCADHVDAANHIIRTLAA